MINSPSGNTVPVEVSGITMRNRLKKLKVQLEESNHYLKNAPMFVDETEAKFKSFFENPHYAAVVISKDKIFLSFNSNAKSNSLAILKKELEIGGNLHDYIDPVAYANFYNEFENALGGEVSSLEVRFDIENGGNVWLQIFLSPIKGLGQDINSVLMTVINISRHAKRSINIMESITDGMFALDTNWNFTYINNKAEKLFKRKRKTLLGKNIWEEFKLGPDHVFFRHYHKAVSERKDIHFEEYSLYMGGWLEVHGYPSKEGISVYFRSINERKKAEEKQKENEEWFQAVLSASRDGFAVEFKERLIYLNEAFLELFGYSKEDSEIVKQLHVSSFYLDETKENLLEMGRKRLNGEPVPTVYETRGRKKDGSSIDIEVSTSVLNLNNHNYIILLIRDITQRKISEKQLLEQNAELLKINKELDRFVYSASHDLRAPLMSVLGLINIAKLEAKERINLEYLDLMTKSINKLDYFVQDIIDYSRNSRLDLKSEEIDLQNLAREIFEELHYLEDADKIKKEVQCNQESLFFNDLNRIKVVLNNIVSNAIRYSNFSKRNPFIKISINITLKEATILVRDNGQGIAPEHINKIFDMFYRASEHNVGSGLGLYIVKETIQKLGGTITVDSKVRKGTTFAIVLPNYLQ